MGFFSRMSFFSNTLPSSRCHKRKSVETEESPRKRFKVEEAEAGQTLLSSRPPASPVGQPEPEPACADHAGQQSEALPPALRDLSAIVISLDRRQDRYEGCQERLRQHSPWLQFERFSACDGRATVMSEKDVVIRWNTARNVVYQRQRSMRKGWDDLHTYQVRDLSLSPGERGCAVSHIRAWELCLQRAAGSNKPLLVLEDDAAPTSDFTSRLEAAWVTTPKDAHVLYLGYSQAANWKREVSADVVESEYVWTTVGYIVWPAGARVLLDRLPVDQPVDNFMAQAAADGALNAYCVRPKIVRQNDAWNTNSDVGHSDEAYWGSDSNIEHSDCFYWGNPEFASTRSPSTSTTANADEVNFPADGKTFWDTLSDDSEDDATGL
eukprot:TRINITY_DN9764_c0_g1_i1.p1 TRINITY_DN9764_c0_g1~~TRINITY_DN9764_c0_g1_i1.p1  ORF type:complete len:380 (+),score=65.37 TRINITY_DN9764_c0_g1_i1:103-1242(+)